MKGVGRGAAVKENGSLTGIGSSSAEWGAGTCCPPPFDDLGGGVLLPFDIPCFQF